MPVETLAILVAGLGENSRTKTKARGDKLPLDTLLLINLCDTLTSLVWGLSGANKKPQFISDRLIEQEVVTKNDRFTSGKEFMEAWNNG